MEQGWIRGLAAATAVAMLALLVAGALVNSWQAAGSVPDWPLSHGSLIPRHWTGNALYEQVHRLIAALVAVLVVWLAVALGRREERGWVRRLGLWAAGLYLFQVLLGGGIVLMHAPHWLGAVHTFLAQLVFAMVFLVMMAGSPRWRRPAGEAGGETPRRLVAAIAHLAVLQVALGAVSRHPPFGQTVFIVTLLTHIAVALVLLVLISMAAARSWRHGTDSRVRRLALALLGLIVLQWAVGLPLFFFSPEPLSETWPPPPGFPHMHATHVAIAALLLAHASALALLARRDPAA